jgi:hypothetical protein
MLTFLTVVIILILGYAFWQEGVLTSFTMVVNIFLSGLVAFNFWEPIAQQMESFFAGSFLAGTEDALTLFGIFAATLGVLRTVTNNLARRQVEYHPLLQRAGSVLCALVGGYLLAGFLLCAWQTLPLYEKFMGFDATVVDGSQGIRRVMPPDRVWLAMMQRASRGPLIWSESGTFDPDGSFELRYAKLRRLKEEPPAAK